MFNMFLLSVVLVVYHIIQMQANMCDAEILLLDILMKKIMSMVSYKDRSIWINSCLFCSGIYEAEQSTEGYEFVSTCYKPKSFQLYQLIEPIKDNYQQTNTTRPST